MNTIVILVSLLLVCNTLANPGLSVACSGRKASSCTVYDCGAIGGDAKWQQDPNNLAMCQIKDCKAVASALTDNYCISCPAVSLIGTSYSNASATKCVGSSYTCSVNRTLPWTNDECEQCFGTGLNAKQYASIDAKSCVVVQPSNSLSSQLSFCALFTLAILII